MKNIAIVTPVKNEIENLPRLIKSIENQSIPLFLWVIIENDSDDGSREHLLKMIKPENVNHFKVLNLQFANKDYKLGIKYATIIKHGFDYLESNENIHQLDFIGILDADCHPEPDYYEKLLAHFQANTLLGLASGMIKYEDNTIEKRSSNHARGGCRLWRKSCFLDSPYETGMSADSISGAKAVINGWQVRTFSDAFVYSRKEGSRNISTYGGQSAYYRHIPFYYVVLLSIFHLFNGRLKRSAGFIIGYLKSYFSKAERLKDPLLKKYFQMTLFRKLGLWESKRHQH
jgi:glycosyltransferase involved in cell wall biosynthesis